jgi:hypothetical protein
VFQFAMSTLKPIVSATTEKACGILAGGSTSIARCNVCLEGRFSNNQGLRNK